MKKLKPMRVLVCGGREKTLRKLGLDPGAVYAKLVKTLNVLSACGARQLTIIHGGANGVDAWAGQWAATTHTPYEVYPVSPDDWKERGPVAGHERNTEMLLKGKPDAVLAFPGGTGTADMVAKVKAMNVRLVEVTL